MVRKNFWHINYVLHKQLPTKFENVNLYYCFEIKMHFRPSLRLKTGSNFPYMSFVITGYRSIFQKTHNFKYGWSKTSIWEVSTVLKKKKKELFVVVIFCKYSPHRMKVCLTFSWARRKSSI